MFSYSDFLTRRINITRITILLLGLYILLFGILNNHYYPQFEDPLSLRIAISAVCILFYVSSFYSKFVRKNFDIGLYSLFIAIIVWSQYILFKNNLHSSYALSLFITFIGMSMAFNKSLFLRIYILFFTLFTHFTINQIDNPLTPVKSFISLFTLLALVDLLIIDTFIQSFKKLQFSNNNFKALLDSVSDGYFLLNKNYKVIKLNEKGKDFIFKKSRKTIKEGSHILDFISLAEMENFISHYQKALTGEKSVLETDIKNFNDGTEWYEIRFLPVISKNKEITSVLYSASDITESKLSKELLEQKNRELQKTNLELDHFVYSAAHDLRAPLTSLLGLINLTKQETHDSQITTYMNFMEKSIKKLDGYIKDIIAYSRNQRTDIEGKEINFKKLINGTFANFSYLEGTNYIIKSLNINHDIPFYSDKQRIQIILNNLISNALKYFDKFKVQPFVNININITETSAIIRIQDNGVGIHDFYQDKIFNMFFRASETSEGSGLGLYIVKETVTKLNGTISVESIFGQGTTFLIEIPNSFVQRINDPQYLRKIG
jgi:signal transduction histidine kinase